MTDRRKFIKAAALTAASYSRILGANDRIRIGGIGTGGRCQYVLSLLNKTSNAQIVALCDVYQPHLDEATKKLAPEATQFNDYRKVLELPDVDAVVIGTPDHWHVPIAIAAVGAGKDVYVEKPVTHHIEEGEPLHPSRRRVQAHRANRHAAAKLAAFPAGARHSGLRRLSAKSRFIRTYWYQNYLLGSRQAHAHRYVASWIGRCSWAPRPISPSMPSATATGAGSGISAAARSPICSCTGWMWRIGACRATRPSMRRPWAANIVIPEWQWPDTVNAAFHYPGNFMVNFDCSLMGYLEGGGLIFHGTKALMRLHRWRLRRLSRTDRDTPSFPI